MTFQHGLVYRTGSFHCIQKFYAIMESTSGPVSRKRQAKDDNVEIETKKSKGGWVNCLVSAMKDPNLKVFEDEQVVIIEDKYPKAKHHFLVLPKEEISSLKHVLEEHLNLLKHMEGVGNTFSKGYPDNIFSDVTENGRVTMKTGEECKRLLGLPLKCRKCEASFLSMPRLKDHIVACR